MFKENKNIYKFSESASYSSNNNKKETSNKKNSLRSSYEREEIETFTSWDFIKKAFKNNIENKFLITIDLIEYTDKKLEEGFKFIKTISPNPNIRLTNAKRKDNDQDLIIGHGIVFIWEKDGKTIKEVPSLFKDKYYEKLNKKTKHHLKEFTKENQINSNLNKIISLLKINQNIENFKKTDLGKEIFKFLENIKEEKEVELENISLKNKILTLKLNKKNLWPASWNLNYFNENLNYDSKENKSPITVKEVKEAENWQNKELMELNRIDEARYYKLQKDATWDEIFTAREKAWDQERKLKARELGLNDDASWKDISEKKRKNRAAHLGLPSDASHKTIVQKLLNLPSSATDEDMSNEIIKLNLGPSIESDEELLWEELFKRYKERKGKYD